MASTTNPSRLLDDELPFEHDLVWRGSSIAIEIARPTVVDAPLVQMPERLLEITRVLAGWCPFMSNLEVECSAEVARRLTDELWQRALVLESAGKLGWSLPSDVHELGYAMPAHGVVEVIAAIVSAGLRYELPRWLPTQSWFGIARSLVQGAFEMRGHAAIRFARRALGTKPRAAVCRHFAAAVQTLFFAVQRTTGSLDHAALVTVTGEAFVTGGPFHAWNLLVDGAGVRVIAIDVSATGDAVAQHRHVSGLLATAIAGYTPMNPLENRAELAELVGALVDPEIDRGQSLLFQIADHPATSHDVRARISTHLAARDFARLVPDWQARLTARSRSIAGTIGGLGALAQLALAE